MQTPTCSHSIRCQPRDCLTRRGSAFVATFGLWVDKIILSYVTRASINTLGTALAPFSATKVNQTFRYPGPRAGRRFG